MDRRRTGSPVYSRQLSAASSSTGSSSPSMSPAHPSSRLGPVAGITSVKKTQNVAAKAAAQRLALVMASHTAEDEEDDEDDDDVVFRGSSAPLRHANSSFSAVKNNNAAPTIPSAKLNRTPSPALGRNFVEHAASVRSASTGRPAISVRSTPVVPPSKTSLIIPAPTLSVEEPPTNKHKEKKRFPSDLGFLSSNDSEKQRVASALRDELDMLQEENEVVSDKLRRADERREQAEARAKELEKQVASLGEGVSLEAKLLSRKEAALRKREDALKAATEDNNGRNGSVIAALNTEIKNLKEESAKAAEQLQEAESEAKALRIMTQRMILTQEEMEEVVLKRCWLSRYWGLALYHGIYPEIAVSKHEHWSSLAPLPFEVVISAGQKAKEESLNRGSDVLDSRNNLVRDYSDISGEGNIESMLSVEMGLRELASLKVEDGVALALAQHRRPSLLRQSISDDTSPRDPKSMEVFELSREESEDAFFKEAWLTYFWKRAKMHGVEEDMAGERLDLWISRSGQSPTSHDVVDVERGLIELRKLGIECQIWEASRKETDQA